MLKDRRDIPKEYKWDLSAIYATDEAFESAYSECEAEIEALGAHADTMNESAEALYAAIKALTDTEEKINKLWVYAALGFYVDTSDSASQAKNSRVRNLAVRFGEVTWFFTPYLLKLGEDKLGEYIASYPALKGYERLLFKIMRDKPHTLSDECERLYSGMEDCLHLHSDVRNVFANSDLRFGKTLAEDGGKVELTDSNYVPLMTSADRKVRRSAFRVMYKTYAQFRNTFSAMYSNYVKEACTLAKVRKYADSRTASTYRDEVTPVIYDNLVENVSKNLPTLFKYYDLKRRALGLSKMHIYDIYTPMVSEMESSYTYDEARAEVAELGDIFGKEYSEVLRRGLYERGWVDVYPARGKRSGAFSAGCASTEPYILLNFNGTFDDISTLAHEAGHSMHSYFSRTYNPAHSSGYTIFVAEVASTVNELLLLRRRVRESTSREEKLYLLNQIMELYKSTLFRQSMLAEFERDAHKKCEEGIPLTADLLCDLYYSIVKKYFGDGVVCDPEIAMEWMRIPHFYMNFYVYKYATCISAASAIVERIENEGDAYVGKYIEFLKCGDAKSPLESLLVAGIDMTSPDVVRPALLAFERAIEEFNEILGDEK